MKRFGLALVDELRAMLLDPGVVLVVVGALVLYAAFYPIPYRAQVLKEVPVVVVDEDQSDLSRKLVRLVDAHELLKVTGDAPSMGEAERRVQSGEAGGVLAIPYGFEKKIRRGEQTSVAAYTDASYFLIYRQVLTGALESVGTLSAGIEIKRLEAQGLTPSQAMKARDPLPMVTRPLFNPAEGYASYVVPAVLVLILQQTLLVGMGMVVGTRREKGRSKESGVASQESVGSQAEIRETSGATRPAGSLATLLGKATAYLALYLVHTLLYFGVVYHLYGFNQRADAWSLLLFTLPFLLAVIFLGLSVRGLFRSREMAMQVLLFTSLPAIFLAGFAWPPEAIPTWLVAASRLLPSTSAIAGSVRMTQMGATLQDVRVEWLFLWGLAGAYFVTAWMAEKMSRA